MSLKNSLAVTLSPDSTDVFLDVLNASVCFFHNIISSLIFSVITETSWMNYRLTSSSQKKLNVFRNSFDVWSLSGRRRGRIIIKQKHDKNILSSFVKEATVVQLKGGVSVFLQNFNISIGYGLKEGYWCDQHRTLC